MLQPCSSCGRLVRHVDVACPFCHVAMTAPASLPVVRGRLGRAARLAAVAALSVACGGTTEPAPNDGGGTDSSTKDASKDAVDEIPIGPAYGGVFVDSGSDADAAADAPADVKQDVPILPPYGQAPLPPEDWIV